MRMSKTYGGFLPLELPNTGHYYSDRNYNVYKYNSAKAGLNRLLEARNINKIYVPYYLCPNVCDELESHNAIVEYYYLDENLLPILTQIEEGEYLYIVDYFGIMDNAIDNYMANNRQYNYIVDNCHSFYHDPIEGVDNIYSCKKFFGVPDGAYLISNKMMVQEEFNSASSYSMYLTKSLEEGTNSCYYEKKEADKILAANYGGMSILADKILNGIDYGAVREKRMSNCEIYQNAFSKINYIKIEEGAIPYLYPLNVGKNIKDKLIEEKIYVPTLWGKCLNEEFKGSLEYNLAEDTLFLPVDQRYDRNDIEYIIKKVNSLL